MSNPQSVQGFFSDQSDAELLFPVHDHVEDMLGKMGGHVEFETQFAAVGQPLRPDLGIADLDGLSRIEWECGVREIVRTDRGKKRAAFGAEVDRPE